MNARIVKRLVCQCWLWLALALLSALAVREAVGQSNYQGIVYGHFPITPTPPPPAYVFPEDSQGWQLSGFVGYPSVSYDFLINGQGAYTFWAAGSGVAVNPSSPLNAVVYVPMDQFGAGDAIPLTYGQLIGPDAAGWAWSVGDWPVGLTANLFSGVGGYPMSQGYFTGLESAYLGLCFQQNGQTYYGWVRLGVPYAGLNSCWLYDYAYSTTPDTPIVAGMGVPDPSTMSQFISTFSAANEAPARASAHSGTGQFTLNGNTLTYDLELDVNFVPTFAGIFGPTSPMSNSRHLVANLGSYTIKPPPSPLFNEPFVFGNVSYTDSVALSEKEVSELLAGQLYVNFTSAMFPRGELRGQIVPLIPMQFTTSLSGANEIPRNASPYHGSGAFTLVGDNLSYSIAVDSGLGQISVGVFNSEGRRRGGGNRVFTIDTTSGVVIPEGGIPGQPGSPGQLLYGGTLSLTDEQAEELRHGEFYVNVSTTQFPRGELRGEILSTAPIQFYATLNGRNEIHRNASTRRGEAGFTLTGNSLSYELALDNFTFTSAGIYASPFPNPFNLIAKLDTTIGVMIPAGGLPNAPGLPGQVLYSGNLTLTDEQVSQIKRGEFYINVLTSRFPRGEIGGRILPAE